jgi:hypothetical protein
MTEQSLFYEPQINASTEALDFFCSNEENPVRWIVLFAQMQSGKTGTYLLTACEMLRMKLVKKVVVFCGHSDIELNNQTQREINLLQERDRTTNKYFNYLKHRFPEMDEDAIWGKCPLATSFDVRFGSAKLKPVIERASETLFIWDESHYAQSIKNTPYEFFKKIGVSPDGNNRILAENRNYFLSISATPFSEIAANHHKEQNKTIITLDVSNSYNSVEKMMANNRIKFYNHNRFTSELRTALNEASERYPSPSYALIRTSEKLEPFVIAGIDQSIWNVVHFDSKEDKAVNSVGKSIWRNMKEAPTKNTVIIIRGRCRMGEVVEKKHVSVMIETSRKSNTDTILQSFVGRACGYTEGSDRIVVWIPSTPKIQQELTTYVEAVRAEHPRPALPTRGTNLVPGSVKFENSLFPVLPIELPLNLSKHHPKLDSREQIMILVKNELSKQSPNWTFQQKHFAREVSILIQNTLDAPNDVNFILSKKLGSRKSRVEVHHVSDNIKKPESSGDKWRKLAENLYISKNHPETDPIPIWTTRKTQKKEDGIIENHEGYNIHLFYFEKENCKTEHVGNLQNNPHTVFLYGVTNCSHIATEEVPLREPVRIPRTTGKEVFSHSLEEMGSIRCPNYFIKMEKNEKRPSSSSSSSSSYPPFPPPPIPPYNMNFVQLFSEETATNAEEMEIRLLKLLALLNEPNLTPEIGHVLMHTSVCIEFESAGRIYKMAKRLYNIELETTLEPRHPGSPPLPEGHAFYTIRW